MNDNALDQNPRESVAPGEARRSRGSFFEVRRDEDGILYVEASADGAALLRDARTNKGTAFTRGERAMFGLHGLLPPQVESLELQVCRAYAGYSAQPTPIAKYQFLRHLQERSEVLFYALLERHIAEMLPIVYTPTVGQAVQEFSSLYHTPRGISFSREAAGIESVSPPASVLAAHPYEDVRLVVATDSSAILGIGDQGYGGLAISIGKLALYTVAGGIDPLRTVPVALDVGTDREDLLEDPLYLGARHKRARGDRYFALFDRFVDEAKEEWPRAIIQWEDLAKETAFAVLERYRDVIPSFNDDIQGTGAVALAGVRSACAIANKLLTEQRVLVYGAGASGIGVALALRDALVEEGLSPEEACARIYVLDSKGLLVESRRMEAYKRRFARDELDIEDWVTEGAYPSLRETIEHAGITVLLGLSGQAGAFTEEVVRAVGRNAERPIIFPLSNPTTSCEAQPVDILRWTEGRALVATGSPFEDVTFDGHTHFIAQGTNAFVFPGLGFGAVLARASKITDGMIAEASRALSDYTAERCLARGMIFPPTSDLRDVSVRVAARVLRRAVAEGVADRSDLPADAERYVLTRAWRARYLPFKKAGGEPRSV
jgi:malate dehydrogenase (oxaloacetate-decarboxylating)